VNFVSNWQLTVLASYQPVISQLSASYQPVISPYYQLSALIDSHGLPFLLKVSQLLSGTPQYLLNICKEAGTSLLHRQTMPTDR